MFYFFLAFFVFTIILTIRNYNNPSTWFLYGMIAGWQSSIFFLTLYLSSHNYYYHTIKNILGLNHGLWNSLVRLNLGFDISIRGLNIGIALFLYSLLGYSLAFALRKKLSTRRKLYFILLLPLLIQVVLYDPLIFRKIHALIKSINYDVAFFFVQGMTHGLSLLFKILNLGYILATHIIMFRFFSKFPKVVFLKNYTKKNIISLLPVSLVFILMFSWFPKIMLRPTLVPNYFLYMYPNFENNLFLVIFLPYIVILGFSFIIIAIFRYNSIETYYKSRDMHITKTIQLGVRAFTHSFKNDLVAITSEVQYLKEKLKDDNESGEIFSHIDKYCEKSFRSLEALSHKVKTMDIDLHPEFLREPVLKAVENFRDKGMVFSLNGFEKLFKVYMDEKYIYEVIYNILENAHEAMADMEEKKVLISLESCGDWGIITITDFGKGITEEDRENVFHPFYSTKNSSTSWGIGLTFSHSIIRAHDGEITIESKPKAGASFKVMLPII